MIHCIVDHSALETDSEPIVNVVSKFNIKSKARFKSKIFSRYSRSTYGGCRGYVGIRLHIVAVEHAAGGKLALDGATYRGVHEEVIVRAKVCSADAPIGEGCGFA